MRKAQLLQKDFKINKDHSLGVFIHGSVHKGATVKDALSLFHLAVLSNYLYELSFSSSLIPHLAPLAKEKYLETLGREKVKKTKRKGGMNCKDSGF